MCGILGYFSTNHELDEIGFAKALRSLKHRGPDDEGFFFSEDRKNGLGHTRLSFLDLSAHGRQPLSNSTKDIWITFNGEIYNYLELKKRLVDLGHEFATGTDTEVIIAGYKAWGIDIFNHLEGMFAFCLYDVNENKSFLVRDRFGIKPLYYSLDKNRLVFASETKAFIEGGFIKKEIDFTAFSDFFVYRYIPSPKSIWKGVSKLPPAHYIECNLVNLTHKLVEYWRPSFSNISYNQKELIEEVDELLYHSVLNHSVADVEIGSFLSGGYDSSALVHYLAKGNYKPKTFSIGFENWKQSEDQYAKLVADKLGVSNKAVIASEKDLSLMDLMPMVYDEPIADISIIPTYMVSRLARKDVKAVMSGEGADEIFCGYGWQQNFYDAQHKNGIIGRLKAMFFKNDTVDFYSHSMAMGHFQTNELRGLLTPDYHRYIEDDVNWFYRKHCKEDLGTLKSIQWMDIKCFMGELVLTKIDRASMANSLEVRVPFLDHKLFEKILSIDESVYFDRNRQKVLLYENLKDHLPKKILDRKKQGFVGPDSYYMNKNWYREQLKDSHLVRDGIINQESINRQLDKWHNWRLWKLVVMENWYRHWMN